MIQAISFIFLAFAVSVIWGILDFDGERRELLPSVKIVVYVFFGLISMAAGLGIVITFLS